MPRGRALNWSPCDAQSWHPASEGMRATCLAFLLLLLTTTWSLSTDALLAVLDDGLERCGGLP